MNDNHDNWSEIDWEALEEMAEAVSYDDSLGFGPDGYGFDADNAAYFD